MQIRTDGLIIMERNIGETDRLITILTKEEGIIRAFAKGVKNIKNKNASATQLFCYSRFVIYKGRDKYIINEADTKEVFFGLRRDIEKLALAQYFCELALALVPESGEAGDFLRLMLNAFYYLANGKIPSKLIKSVVEMRMLSMAGYMPNLICCKKCGVYESDKMYFLPGDGVIYCDKCYKTHSNGILLTRGVITALRHTIYADFEKIFSFKISESAQNILSVATEKYLTFQLGRYFKTLEFYHGMVL